MHVCHSLQTLLQLIVGHVDLVLVRHIYVGLTFYCLIKLLLFISCQLVTLCCQVTELSTVEAWTLAPLTRSLLDKSYTFLPSIPLLLAETTCFYLVVQEVVVGSLSRVFGYASWSKRYMLSNFFFITPYLDSFEIQTKSAALYSSQAAFMASLFWALVNYVTTASVAGGMG